jgi:hypothetical protein
MRVKTMSVLVPVLLCAVLSAQDRAHDRNTNDRIAGRETDRDADLRSAVTHPLNLSEGLAILGAALESRHRGKAGNDCSHLVQIIYEKAGFSYSYANSFQLYEGIDQFRRVTTPQSGDLAVWKGHVGIVVNPGQHSFFSLLRSGRGVETYDSPYWKRRGNPRFFRYVKAAPVDAFPAPVNATLIPTSLEIRPLGQNINLPRTEASLPMQPPVPNALVRVSNSAKPTPDQLSSALLKSFRDSEGALQTGDVFRMTQPLTIFDQFEVKTVRISGNQGWAEVQIHEVLSLPAAGAQINRLWERQRWALRRRDKNSWELTLPQNATYLSQEMAVRIMAHQLANLADSNSNSPTAANQKAELARLLSSLLENQSLSGTR